MIFQSPLWADSEPPNDPVSLRVFEFIREDGHYVDIPLYPKHHPYWQNLQWFRDQGDAVRPALMYLLTEEYRGNYSKMSDMVSTLANAPGDQTKVLDFVRSELAEQPEARPDDYSLFLSCAMSALSAHGDRNDLILIQGFESDDDVLVRLSAERHARNLAKRLAEGQTRPLRSPVERDDREAPRTDPPAAERSEAASDAGAQIGSRYAVWCAAVILLVALFIYFAVRHRGS